MKRIYISLLLALLYVFAYAEVTANQKSKALEIAKSICGDGEYDYFYSSDIVAHTYGNRYRVPSLLVFVDMVPNCGWSHECKYIYIPTAMNTYEVVDSLQPPSDITLRPLELQDSNRRAIQNFRLPKICTNDGEKTGMTYAIILNGGMNKNANNERYWNDCSFIYQTLHNIYDIPRTNIKVLSADGTDPEPDMKRYIDDEIVNSPLDLDGDGYADIQYAATKENLQIVFSELKNTITDKDQLFVFVTGHGQKPDRANRDYYIYLWNNETLYPDEFSEFIDSINAKCVNIIMGQCYAGGFINSIHGNNRIITTACSEIEKSYGLMDIPFDAFLYYWTSAIAKMDPFSNGIDADKDKNSHISMNEAFEYATCNDPYSSGQNRFGHESPQIDYVAGTLSDDLSFDRMPEDVDLYIRDHRYDTGKEPSKPHLSMWSSPDLYLRMQDDGDINKESEMLYVEDPESGEVSFYIYCNIHNRGSKAYDPKVSSKFIHLFLTNANGRITSEKFKGLNLYSSELGEHIARPKIAEKIEPGDSFLISRKVTLYKNFDKLPSNDNLYPIAILGVITDDINEAWENNQDSLDMNPLVKQAIRNNDIAMWNVDDIYISLDECVNNQDKVFDVINVDSCEIKVYASNQYLKNSLSLHLPNNIGKFVTDNDLSFNEDETVMTRSSMFPFYSNIVDLTNVSKISKLNFSSIQKPVVSLKFNKNKYYDINKIQDGDTITIEQCSSKTGEILAGITYIVRFAPGNCVNETCSSPKITTINVIDDRHIRIGFSEIIDDATLSISSNYENLKTTEYKIKDSTSNTIIELPEGFDGMLFISLYKDRKILDSKKIIN